MRNRLLSAIFILATPAWALAQQASVLWYDKPATDWEKEALPIGNGRMGAMVFGGVQTERLQFSEKSLWTGGPGTEGGYDYGLPAESQVKLMRSVGAQLLEGGKLEPEPLAKQLGRKMHNYGDYQSFGEVVIERIGADQPVSNYRRELDLDGAIARVSFKQGGAEMRREYLASYPDQVIIARWSSSGAQKLRVSLALPDNRTATIRAERERLFASGALKSNGLRYATGVELILECGEVKIEKETLLVDSTCPVTFFISARTNYRMHYPDYRIGDEDANFAAGNDLLLATVIPWPKLLERHQSDHRDLYQRARLDIATAAPAVPTDRLRASYGSGDAAADRWLEQLYFNYGRYLLIASSRRGSLPANLQGVWNDKATPPWNADYHVNINLQMNYWPAEMANLAETAEPLFDFVDHLVPPGRLAAQRYFGAQGWTMFLNTNIWGYVGPIDWPTAFWQPEASAWLAQHYYEHYLFSGDKAFLTDRAWPVMKEAAQFWLDALVVDPRDKKLVVSPSYSPEHGPFTAGAAMSQQIVADLFENTAQTARLVGDKAFAKKLDAALARLDRGLRVGSWGQLQEWKLDLDDPKSDHRHVSQLFALHPGRAIDPSRDAALAAAARKTLDARGDASTGWSRAWKINFWARLRDGDRAHKLLAGLLAESTLPNLWDTHPPFQIDGNFGATAGMIEMLLQSQNGEIHILPALPKAWSKGSVSGIRARGDVTLAIGWDACGAHDFILKAGRDGPLTVRSPLFEQEFAMNPGPVDPKVVSGTGDVRTVQAKAGQQYWFRRVQRDCGAARP